jgi:hypothetical protein
MISEEMFVKCSAWFDSYTKNVDRNYSHPYPRADIIKRLMFRIHKSDSESMPIKALADLLRSRELRQTHKNPDLYKDLIFIPS